MLPNKYTVRYIRETLEDIIPLAQKHYRHPIYMESGEAQIRQENGKGVYEPESVRTRELVAKWNPVSFIPPLSVRKVCAIGEQAIESEGTKALLVSVPLYKLREKVHPHLNALRAQNNLGDILYLEDLYEPQIGDC